MFEIYLDDKSKEVWGELSYEGKITIDNWSEKFYSPAVFWKKEDYLQSWKNEITKILDKKSKCAKLFTTMYSPEMMNFCRAWILYGEEDKIYIREKIFFVDNFKIPFELKQIYDLKLERETINDDGDIISEWQTTIHDVKVFQIKLEKHIKQMSKT